MERPALEDAATPERTHVQEDLPRSDVQFPYGTDDGTSQGSLPYGFQLAPATEAASYRETGAGGYQTTPVLVTRGSTTKGTKGPLVCHVRTKPSKCRMRHSTKVEGCQRDLTLEKKYYKRYRVCMEHLKMNAIYVDGNLQRFCQQCGRFHDLSKFDGEKRNCRERLSQHNRRRRKSKREAGGSDGSLDDISSEEPSNKMQKGRRSKRLSQKTTPSLWPSGHTGFDDGSHGITSEEHSALGSVGMEMIHGIPVTPSSGLHHFAGSMTLPETQQSTQERESLYNMVVHHVIPAAPSELTVTDSKPPSCTDISTTSVAASGADAATPNLTTLLQIPDAAAAAKLSETMEGEGTTAHFPVVGVQGGAGMLQSLRVNAPGSAQAEGRPLISFLVGNNMPTVPMLVFPSSSAPHQLSAVAIIPSATSSCSTIVPLPWQGTNPQASELPAPSLPLPIETSLPMETPNSTAPAGSNEIPPIVSLALSASGIAQAAGSHAQHPAISPNQLAHFQMLMARQISMSQAPEIIIPEATANAVKTRYSQKEEDSKKKSEGNSSSE